MNTIIKKCSAITLAVALCCSVFAGCSSEQADKTADSGFQIKTNAVVSYLGPEGTYTEEAAKFFFQPELFTHILNCICKWLCIIRQLQS